MSEIQVENPQDLAADLNAAHVQQIREQMVNDFVDITDPQSLEDFGNYLQDRPTEAATQTDEHYMNTVAETDRGYENMSMTELAKELGEAEVSYDRTKLEDVQEILDTKIENFFDAVKNESKRSEEELPENHYEQATQNLRNRLDVIRAREVVRLQSEAETVQPAAAARQGGEARLTQEQINTGRENLQNWIGQLNEQMAEAADNNDARQYADLQAQRQSMVEALNRLNQMAAPAGPEQPQEPAEGGDQPEEEQPVDTREEATEDDIRWRTNQRNRLTQIANQLDNPDLTEEERNGLINEAHLLNNRLNEMQRNLRFPGDEPAVPADGEQGDSDGGEQQPQPVVDRDAAAQNVATLDQLIQQAEVNGDDATAEHYRQLRQQWIDYIAQLDGAGDHTEVADQPADDGERRSWRERAGDRYRRIAIYVRNAPGRAREYFNDPERGGRRKWVAAGVGVLGLAAAGVAIWKLSQNGGNPTPISNEATGTVTPVPKSAADKAAEAAGAGVRLSADETANVHTFLKGVEATQKFYANQHGIPFDAVNINSEAFRKFLNETSEFASKVS